MGNVFKTPNHYEVYFVNYMHEEGPSDISRLNNLFKGKELKGLNNLFKGKELKVFTIVFRLLYYRGEGINSKILEIETVPDETAETLVSLVNNQLQKYNITEKCVALTVPDETAETLFFNNQYAEGYLYLIRSVMAIIHTNIERVERNENSIVEIRKILDKVISLLEERITNNFCPLRVRTILKKLHDKGKNTEEFSTKIKLFYNEINDYLKMRIEPFEDLTEEFSTKIKLFYNEINDYLKMRIEPFEDLKVFDWIDLTGSDLLDWSNIEKSLIFLKDHGIETNDEKLFDEWVNLKNCSANLNPTQKHESLNTLWLRYFKQCFSEERLSFLEKQSLALLISLIVWLLIHKITAAEFDSSFNTETEQTSLELWLLIHKITAAEFDSSFNTETEQTSLELLGDMILRPPEKPSLVVGKTYPKHAKK
ncbi:hypothetical protein QE152_g4533 [Popillia japonica]|uniref:Uncharacterized protein n=1 Tax=Popillia japonica TaxID=7064 RepID=A0AAW1N0E7_POPJA